MKKNETGFDKLARLIKSESDDIRSTMATKDDLKNFATKDDVRAIVDGAVDKAKKEIIEVVGPIAKAVDKDAVTIINHEKRIIKIERHLAIK